MGWTPLAPGETPDNLLHMARLLRDFMPSQLVDTNKLPPPASKTIVENLPRQTISQTNQQCPVCLKVYSMGDQALQLPCKHLFHSSCIQPWLSRTNSCPLCRHEMATDDEDYEAYRKEKLRAKQREEDIEHLHNSMFS